MKTPLLSALILLAWLANTRADLTIVQQIEGAGPVAQVTMKIKGDKARIEATPQVTSIFDGKTGEVLSILNDQKMVMRTSAAQAKAAASAMAAQTGQPAAAPGGKLKITPSGKKETINGFETEEFVVDNPSYKASYWIARNYPQGEAIMKQLQAMNPDALNTGAMATPDFRDFPGLPIRTNVTMGDTKFVSTIKSVNLDPLPATEFAVPAGYQEMKMPDVNSMLGKPDAAKTDAAKPAASPKR